MRSPRPCREHPAVVVVHRRGVYRGLVVSDASSSLDRAARRARRLVRLRSRRARTSTRPTRRVVEAVRCPSWLPRHPAPLRTTALALTRWRTTPVSRRPRRHGRGRRRAVLEPVPPWRRRPSLDSATPEGCPVSWVIAFGYSRSTAETLDPRVRAARHLADDTPRRRARWRCGERRLQGLAAWLTQPGTSGSSCSTTSRSSTPSAPTRCWRLDELLPRRRLGGHHALGHGATRCAREGARRCTPTTPSTTRPPSTCSCTPAGRAPARSLKDEAHLEWVRDSAPYVALLTTVCTGLARPRCCGPARRPSRDDALGRTRRARAIDPTIDVRRDVRYVDDGDAITSAGVSAGIDMALHLVVAPRVTWNAPWRCVAAIQYDPDPPV